MSTGTGLSIEVLGRITLLQSMVTLLPDQVSMLEFICQGLKDVAGVRSVTYRIFDNLPLTDDQTAGQTPVPETIQVFPVKYNAVKYAELSFDLALHDAFLPYIPFLKNFANMLAVLFDAQAQTKLNETLRAELEQRVAARTRELQEKTDNLRITLNSIGDAVISTDIRGRVVCLNPVAEKLTGWNATEANGKNLTEIFAIFNSETLQPAVNPIEKVLATGAVVGLANHTILISRDGMRHQIADSAAPIRSTDGPISGVVLVFRDVTDEYRIAAELKASEETYREIVEGTSDLITRTDDVGCFTFINHRAKEVFGLSETKCHGETAFEFIHPEDREATEKWFNECLARRLEQAIIENRQINRVTQEVFNFLWTCNFHYDRNGRLLAVNSVGHDITARKRAEAEYLKYELQNQQARKLESLGVLAGGIAHDFNNILMGLFGSISLAKSDLSRDHPGFKSLENAEKSMGRAIRLSKQLLTFAKGGDPVKEDCSLGALVEEVARFDLSGSNVMLVYKQAPDLGLVKVDKSQIQQVMSNLIINARQAMPHGGHLFCTLENVVLQEGLIPGLSPGKYIQVIVRDEGPGIDSQCIDRIFDPYYTTKQTGNGLGLATTFSIITKHGGHIGVESEPGKGATFTFYLPASESRHLPQAVAASARSSLIKPATKIMILDDEEIIRLVGARWLKRVGCLVETSADCIQAIDLYTQAMNAGAPFDVVILDLTIPGGMGGLQVLKTLLAVDPKIKAIASSGYTEGPVMLDFASSGFKGSISKPYTENELIEVLARVLK